MALVVYDPAVETISGKLGNFVYYRRRSTACVRVHVAPGNPRTPLQQHGRRSFAEAIRLWQALEPYKRLQWNRRALVRTISGYNMFISEHLKDAWKSVAASFGRDPVRSCPLPLRSLSVFSGESPERESGGPGMHHEYG